MAEFEYKQEHRMKTRLDRYRELGKIEKEVTADLEGLGVDDKSINQGKST